MEKRSAIVVGGGIAGIASALALADRGVAVTLLEATRRLGGRATSHVDRQTGEEIDNCQHVTMGACTAYNALLERLGVADAIEWTDAQTWFDGEGRARRVDGRALPVDGHASARAARASMIAPGGLAPPLHYARSFARARFLSALDKAAIAGAMGLIATARRDEWGGRTFLEFLDHAGQPESAVRRFWSPVVVSACNLGVERVSAAPALMVFQRGLLAGAEAARIGVPRVPLGRLYERVPALLAAAGGSVEFGVRVEGVREVQGRAVVHVADSGGVRRGGEAVEAAMVVIASAPSRALDLLPDEMSAQMPMRSALEHSAIMGIHLRADRPVLSVPHAVLVGRETQWVFRKDASGRRLHAVISAASSRVLAMSEDEAGRMAWKDIVACIPAARDARLEWWRVIKSRQATFAATPAFEAVRPRPGPIGPRSCISLAGDYTRTGWPATMEGAARSGLMAVEGLGASMAAR